MKTVHAFDYETRRYIGPLQLDASDLSPLERDVYLVPGNCLESNPPVPPPGMEVFARELPGSTSVWDLRALAALPVPEAEPTLERSKSMLKARVTAERWHVENSGITLPDGYQVLTRIEDQNRICNAASNVTRLGLQCVNFKGAEGRWNSLPIARLIEIADAVALHVQSCFDAERVHHEAIEALDASGVAAYDVLAGWPKGAA